MQIYNQLREDINARKYHANQRLPTEKELCQMYHVSRITSKKALNMLVDDNLIVRIKGKGSYISHSQSQKDTTQDIYNNKQVAIGVIMSEFDNAYGQDMLASIEENCRINNAICIFYRPKNDQHAEEKAIDDLVEFGVDGIIILPVHGVYYNAKILRLILDGFPVVVVDRDLRGIPTHFVGTDNVIAAEQAIDHLIQAGHTKIGIYSHESKKTSTLEDRMEGVQRSLQKNNIMLDSSYFFTQSFCQFPISKNQEAFVKDRASIMQHIQANKDMTAAFGVEYHLTTIIKSAIEGLGMKVPDDISIICFDSPKMEIPSSYTLTHMRQNQEEIGKRAFDLLLSLIHGQVLENNLKISLAAELVHGNSIKKISTS